MPKSKRSKVVPLTKTKKKGRSAKEQLVDAVHEAVTAYQNGYVMSFENMRAGPFKQMQHELRDDTLFFLGKNKVIQVALGKTAETECADNTAQLGRYMRGQVCLVFSNKT